MLYLTHCTAQYKIGWQFVMQGKRLKHESFVVLLFWLYPSACFSSFCFVRAQSTHHLQIGPFVCLWKLFKWVNFQFSALTPTNLCWRVLFEETAEYWKQEKEVRNTELLPELMLLVSIPFFINCGRENCLIVTIISNSFDSQYFWEGKSQVP